MKWIVLAILLAVVPYTLLRWFYRKEGPAFEPYQDIRNRANTARLVSAGFQRITLEAERPAEPRRSDGGVATTAAPGGLPEALDSTLVDQPQLAGEIRTVAAAPFASSFFAYPIDLTCTVPNEHQQLGGAYAYVRDGEIVVVAEFERVDGELLARTRNHLVRLTFPAGSLKPGNYRVLLVGARSSRAWSLEVR